MDWDSRFAGEDYLFGRAPAAFLVAQGHRIPRQARASCTVRRWAEGATPPPPPMPSTSLARLGHHAGVDEPLRPSSQPQLPFRQGAHACPAEAGVDVGFPGLPRLEDWDWSGHRSNGACRDLHPVPAARGPRAGLFARFAGAVVRPGGLILLHGYAPRQVGLLARGGRKAVENMLHRGHAFPRLPRDGKWLHSADYDARSTRARAIRAAPRWSIFVARKPGH